MLLFKGLTFLRGLLTGSFFDGCKPVLKGLSGQFFPYLCLYFFRHRFRIEDAVGLSGRWICPHALNIVVTVPTGGFPTCFVPRAKRNWTAMD